MNKRWAFMLACAVTSFMRCAQDESSAGNGSQSGNPAVTGVVCFATGAAAANAVVDLIPSGASASPSSGTQVERHTTVTDSRGAYGFDSLPEGYYAVWAERAGTSAFRDSVHVAGITDVGRDTLRETGTVRGRVSLRNGDDPRTVMLVVFGSALLAGADSTGAFTLGPMAPGCYRVRLLSWLDLYSPLDTVLCVRSGMQDSLAAPVRLRVQGLAPPEGVTATYDIATGTVVLHWQAAGIPGAGYIVYRSDSGSAAISLLTQSALWSTSYADTVHPSVVDTSEAAYTYRIKTVDGQSNQSAAYSSPVTVHTIGNGTFRTVFRPAITFPDTVELGTPVQMAFDFVSRTYRIESLWWTVSPQDSIIRERTVLANRGRDTVDFVAAALGTHMVRFHVLDSTAHVWTDSAQFTCVGNYGDLLGLHVDTSATSGTTLTVGWNYVSVPSPSGLRLLVSRGTIALGTGTPDASVLVREFPSDSMSYCVTGLLPSTNYCVALQVLVNGQWSLVVDSSRIWVKTGPSPVVNPVAIDRAYLDTVTGTVVVIWHPISASTSADSAYEYGWVAGPDTSSALEAPSQWLRLPGGPDTLRLDTTAFLCATGVVYAGVRVRSIVGAVSSAVVAVVVLPAGSARTIVEPFTYFSQPIGDTVWALNRTFGMWSIGAWMYGRSRDTVEVVTDVLMPDSLVAVGTAVRFRVGLTTPDVMMALAVTRQVPSPRTLADVRIYAQLLDGQWVACVPTQVLADGSGVVHAPAKLSVKALVPAVRR